MKINTIRLRLIIGILAILLPIIVAVLALIFNCLPGYLIPDSISATYYLDPCITPFMIILGSASILLICYSGYEKEDDIICTLSGIFGLFICLFPCDNEDLVDIGIIATNVGTFQTPVFISGLIHNVSAVIFFLFLAYNSYFLFTKGSSNPTPNKRKRNIVYKLCGIGMISSLVFIIPIMIFEIWGGTWIVETIALFFFGISWLTKCDIFPFLFCDTPYKD